MSLIWVGQEDFAAGVLKALAKDTQSGIGVENAINGLFDDDGDCYRRGAVTRYTPAPAPAGLTFIWSGYLGTKYCELLATASRLYALSGTDFVDLGPPGLVEPALPAVLNDTVFLPDGIMWGGSTEASYSVGTASTDGTAKVTGVGTTWVGNVEPGMFYVRTGWAGVRIKSVDSNTQLTLDSTVPSAAAAAYSITALATNNNQGKHVGTIFDRLIIATGNILKFSPAGDPFSVFVATDYHELPDGVEIMGITAIRDRLLVFTNYGLWAIDGMAFDLVDDNGNVQQQMSRLTPELSLWHEAGLTDYAGMIVAPCVDRCFLVDGVSPPLPITDSIQPLYMKYVRGGFRPGGAKVYRNHLFLPILDQASNVEAVLVCRVNRPVRGRQVYYPWSQLAGYPALTRAFDVQLRTTVPVLLGAHQDGHVCDVSPMFAPFSVDPPLDPDGQAPVFDLETRDFPAGNGQPTHVRKLRLRYTSEGVGEVKAATSYGSQSQTYQQVTDTGATYTDVFNDYPDYAALVVGTPIDPEQAEWLQDDDRYWNVLGPQQVDSPGIEPLDWHLRPATRVRYLRARLRVTDPLLRITVHELVFAARPNDHKR